jgi:UV DNA damage endonuclease
MGRSLERLPGRVRKRLTLENDERVYAPRDLLPFCRSEQVPLVYDVHHHRCLPDGYSVEQVTDLALATWNREPLFHVSSPRDGWRGPQPSRHGDFIAPRDFPREWLHKDLTVEVEAKAKELAVLRLARYLAIPA